MSFLRNEIAVSLVDDSYIFSAREQLEPLVMPAYVAFIPGSRRVLTVGEDARAMLGRTAENIEVVKVLSEGRPWDQELSAALFRHSIQKMRTRAFFTPRPIVAIAIRNDPTAKALIKNVALAGGAIEVHLIEMGMATAIGMQLEVMKPEIQAVLSISDDWFDFSVISVSSVLARASGGVGSETFVEDIQNHLSLTRGFRPEAQAIRSRLMKDGMDSSTIASAPGWEVWSGRSEQGRLRTESISQADLTIGLMPSLTRMIERIKGAIRTLSSEQQYQLSTMTIHATGRALQIPGLARALSDCLGHRVISHTSAHHPSIEGAKVALGELKFLRQQAAG